MGAVKEVKSKDDMEKLVSNASEMVIVVHFWAEWCDASKQMDQVFSHLATDFPHAQFLRVEAEEQPEISEAYSVSAVPYFVILKDGKVAETLEGADPSSLANKVSKVAGSVIPGQASGSVGLAAGAAVVETVKELAKDNNSPALRGNPPNLKSSLTLRLDRLINSAPVMLFMKGTPEEPQCGFSGKVVEILHAEKVTFGSFDILSDDEVRQGLKVHSNWSSYPQLYINGELIGGSDIVLEMQKSGELRKILSEKRIGPVQSLDDRLLSLTNSSPVMLFMKGSPDAPRCGFSNKVVGALRQEGIDFGFFDILTDEEVRQGMKTFSNWPTFPQLYYKGELVGGCDIVMELKNNGDLKQTLSE